MPTRDGEKKIKSSDNKKKTKNSSSLAKMKLSLELYNNLKRKVKFLYDQLKLFKREKTKGRKLAIKTIDIISLALYKHRAGINTKKNLYEIFNLKCSYKTLVVNLNRFARWSALFLVLLMKVHRQNSHLVKHTDSTDLPVCLNKNGNHHKTMEGLANWGHSGKGWFYGLKMHITTDLRKKLLALKFSSGNVHDSQMFIKLNKGLKGIFVADSAYTGDRLQKEFYQETGRLLIAKPRKNMRKIMTDWQDKLYQTRMLIEINFKNLKMFYGLVSSLPRSINGYLANYIHSLLAYCLA